MYSRNDSNLDIESELFILTIIICHAIVQYVEENTRETSYIRIHELEEYLLFVCTNPLLSSVFCDLTHTPSK